MVRQASLLTEENDCFNNLWRLRINRSLQFVNPATNTSSVELM